MSGLQSPPALSPAAGDSATKRICRNAERNAPTQFYGERQASGDRHGNVHIEVMQDVLSVLFIAIMAFAPERKQMRK